MSVSSAQRSFATLSCMLPTSQSACSDPRLCAACRSSQSNSCHILEVIKRATPENDDAAQGGGGDGRDDDGEGDGEGGSEDQHVAAHALAHSRHAVVILASSMQGLCSNVRTPILSCRSGDCWNS